MSNNIKKLKSKDSLDEFLYSKTFITWRDTLVDLMEASRPKIEWKESKDSYTSKLPEIIEPNEDEAFKIMDDLIIKSIELGLFYKSLEEKEGKRAPELQGCNLDLKGFDVELKGFGDLELQSLNLELKPMDLKLDTPDLNLVGFECEKLTDKKILEVIKDLQHIEGKTPEDIFKKLKDYRASR